MFKKLKCHFTIYVVYKNYRTNLKCFRRGSFSVVRRYSDFLGLHEKLVGRYQYRGRIIPPPPEKSIIGTLPTEKSNQIKSKKLYCYIDYNNLVTTH